MESGSSVLRVTEAWVEVPDSEASVEVVLEFAGTYDAYTFFADQPDPLQRLLGGLYDEIAWSLAVPEWVRLDLARAVLFYAYRLDYFAGGGGPYEPMVTLVNHIRDLSGGWVMVRAGPAPGSLWRATDATGSARHGEFDDSWAYSDDRTYRWWYERRWDTGPACASWDSTPPPVIRTASRGQHLPRSSTGPSERGAAPWSWSICSRTERRTPETFSLPAWTLSARETTG